MNALHTILNRGRHRLLRRALVTGAVRGLCLSSAVVLPLAGGAFLLERLFGLDPLARPHLLPGILSAGATLLVGSALVARLRVRAAARCWPRLWDRAAGWRARVETIVDIHARGNASPWSAALLEQAADLRLPPASQVTALLPWRLTRPLTISAIALVGTLVAGVAPIPDLRAGVSIAARESAADAWRERMQRSHARLADLRDPHVTRVRAALEAILDDWAPGTLPDRATRDALARALAHAHQWQTAERRAAAARHRAAAFLERNPQTRALARWLTDGTVPDELPASAAPATAQALGDAARDLADDLPGVARWLARLAEGDTTEPPRLDASEADWRIASDGVVELRRLAAALEAGFRDESTGAGGSDPAADRDTGNDDDPTASWDPTQDPDAIVRIEGGLGLGNGERLDDEVFRPTSLEGSPEWRRILERPAIEPYWLGVVERYRAELEARTGGKANPR